MVCATSKVSDQPAHTRRLVRAFASPLNIEVLTEHFLEFLSLKGGCTGLSESTLVKMPHCWKSHVAAQICVATSRHYKRTVLYTSFSPELVQGSVCAGLQFEGQLIY